MTSNNDSTAPLTHPPTSSPSLLLVPAMVPSASSPASSPSAAAAATLASDLDSSIRVRIEASTRLGAQLEQLKQEQVKIQGERRQEEREYQGQTAHSAHARVHEETSFYAILF